MFSANENPGEIEHFARAILLISDIWNWCALERWTP
jgi:hypothetical protein